MLPTSDPISLSLPLDSIDDVASAFSAAEIGVWRWDSGTNEIHLSKTAQACLNQFHEKLSLRTFLDSLNPEERGRVAPVFQDLLQEGHLCDIQFRLASKYGEKACVRMRGRQLLDKNGESAAFGIMFRVPYIATSADANARLATIVASSDDAIIGKTLDGLVTDWNAGAEAIFGYTAEEIVGKPITLLLPPDKILEESEIQERIRRGERIDHFETRRRRKDGQIIDVSITVSPLWDETGRLVGASKIARDITAARRSQVVLAEREAQLKSVLETVPEAMIVIDTRGLILSFSVMAERMFGYVVSEVIGRNVSLLMPSPDREQHDHYLARYLESGEKRVIGKGRVVVGQRKDGSTFPMELSVGEVRTANRRFFTGFIRDISERQRTQKRLQELQAEIVHMSRFTALGEMASALAHELNQPLSAIANYLKGGRRLLENQSAESLPIIREAMQHATEQALRAGQIIRRLRDFVARGETEQRLEPLPLLVEEASALALVGVKEYGVRATLDLDPAAEFVFADKIQIQQVLLNLIRNALEAMQDCPVRELKISTRRIDDAMSEIIVADTGTGISEEIADRLFNPFVTTKRHGMGVGLSISRTIVEAHGGKLWVDSDPGKGSIFHLTLKSGIGDDSDTEHA